MKINVTNRQYNLIIETARIQPWVGYDDNTYLKDTDYKYIKKIWANTMEGYLKDKDNSWYEKPKDIVGVMVNPITGELANKTTQKKKIFYYLLGTEPVN